MNLTAKRRAWLERLLLGPAHRPRGRTGFDCMQAKLTEWNYLDHDNGEPIGFEEAKARWGMPELWSHIVSDGERITQKGRDILMANIEQQRIEGVWTVLEEVRAEAFRAMTMFPPFHSHHEGYAVLLEEVDELWDEVKANNHAKARAEAVQVAAMAIRFLVDLEG